MTTIKLQTQNPTAQQRIIITRARLGETKEQYILRRLGAGSFAHAVIMFKLGDLEPVAAWQKLESLAAREVQIRRSYNRLTRTFAKFRKLT